MSTHKTFSNIVRSDHFVLPIRVRKDGVATTIVGWTFWMTFKKTLGETDADALAAGRQVKMTAHDDPSNGKTTLTLLVPADKTVDRYYYDVQYLTATGVRRTPLYGEILLVDERTLSAT